MASLGGLRLPPTVLRRGPGRTQRKSWPSTIFGKRAMAALVRRTAMGHTTITSGFLPSRRTIFGHRPKLPAVTSSGKHANLRSRKRSSSVGMRDSRLRLGQFGIRIRSAAAVLHCRLCDRSSQRSKWEWWRPSARPGPRLTWSVSNTLGIGSHGACAGLIAGNRLRIAITSSSLICRKSR